MATESEAKIAYLLSRPSLSFIMEACKVTF